MSDPNIAPAEVIQKLGGNAKTAALCEITPSAVSQWLVNGIPRTQLKFLKVARPDIFKSDAPKRRRSDKPPPP